MIYVKIIAALIVCGIAFYLGGLRYKAQLESLEASQAENTARAVLAERASAQTELNRVNQVVAKYEAQPIDPIALNVGSRVLEYTRIASCPVPKTATNPSGTGNAPQESPDTSAIERTLTAYSEACSQDANQLAALIAAWPR